MSQFSLSGVGVEFGATVLLRDVTFTIGAGERWGIVGRNGAGKTTLFQLLTGARQPSSGVVARAPGLRITVLDQHRDFGDATTVWAGAAMAYGPLMALELSLAEQAQQLAELGDKATPAMLDKYGHDLERFGHEGGYEFHARVDAILHGLGFDPDDARTRPLTTLSGGERGRVGLAAQLAAPADVLLLDEPTNHLDLDTTRWLTEHLKSREGTLVVISHDRAFLDETVDHVLHVEAQTAFAYRGGYSSFVTQRAERRLAHERQLENQRKMIAKEEDYIRRNIAGQNSSQAKGRRKRLERLPRLTPPPGEAGAMALRFEAAERGGDIVASCEKLTLRVGDRTLLRDFTGTVRRGDVLAVVGPNGAGKSTLLKTVLGERPADGGVARLGGSISAGWFRQDLGEVSMGKSLYDVIQDERNLWTRGQIQGLLGAFGFSGDEVMKRTDSCSGGERSRLALALLTLRKANVLVLDEPTNHLDVESIEAIEDAIDEYEGTVILVSHDRAFLRELATRVWAYDGDRLEDFDGSFQEWEARQAERAKAAARAEAEARSAAREADRERAKRNAASQGKAHGDRRALKRALEEAERDVAAAEARLAEAREAVADPSLYDGSAAGAREGAERERRLRDAEAALEGAMHRWAAAEDALGG